LFDRRFEEPSGIDRDRVRVLADSAAGVDGGLALLTDERADAVDRGQRVCEQFVRVEAAGHDALAGGLSVPLSTRRPGSAARISGP